MDIHERAVEYLKQIETVMAWPQMEETLELMTKPKPRGWELATLACGAVGGSEQDGVPAAAAIACLQIAIILIDDMLDRDPRGVHHRIGKEAAANLASAFQAAGLSAIEVSHLDTAKKLEAINRLNEMMLITAYGQSLDVVNPDNEADYWEMVRAKSSPYSAAMLSVGALCGGASSAVAEKMDALGALYGELIQVHDDFKDAMAIPVNPDWTEGRNSLPILFAAVVDHPERDRFLELRGQVGEDEEALREAQDILIRCGAISYCVDQMTRRYQKACRMIDEIALPKPEKVQSMFEEVVEPVREVLRTLDMAIPEALVRSSQAA